MCQDIARVRRMLMRRSKAKVLFLDETKISLSEHRSKTLVAPGQTAFVVVTDNTPYASRYDMIACCSSEREFPPIVYSPEDRKDLDVKGVRKFMLLNYINDILAQAIGAIGKYPLILVMDGSNVHSTTEILEAFHEVGCQGLETVYIMPTKSAKRLSPLDNSLFHEWKERIRSHDILTKSNVKQIMCDEWNKFSADDLIMHYRNCGLMNNIDTLL